MWGNSEGGCRLGNLLKRLDEFTSGRYNQYNTRHFEHNLEYRLPALTDSFSGLFLDLKAITTTLTIMNQEKLSRTTNAQADTIPFAERRRQALLQDSRTAFDAAIVSQAEGFSNSKNFGMKLRYDDFTHYLTVSHQSVPWKKVSLHCHRLAQTVILTKGTAST